MVSAVEKLRCVFITQIKVLVEPVHYSNKGLGGTSSSPIVWVLAILGCRRQVSDFISGVGLLPSCVTQDDEHGLAISSLA